MKNKKLLYILVPTTIILWGMIVFRIREHINKVTEVSPIFSMTGNYFVEKQVEDTFILMADYSDPFLDRKQLSSIGNIYESNIRRPDISKTKQKVIVQWPEVKYGGMIVNKSNNGALYLIKVDNINHMLKKGDYVGQIKIVKVYKDSITIQLQNNYKTIIKERI